MESANLNTLGTRLSLNLIPVSMTIELTKRCCLNCIHCARDVTQCSLSGLKPSNNSELSVDQWKSVLDQLKKAGTLEITLTGGEPFLYRGFFDLLDYAGQLKFAVTLFTNGVLIDKKAADILKKSYIRQVQISIYSSESKTHDSFTGCRGSHKKTVKAFEYLQEMGIRVRAAVMVSSFNYKTLKQTIAWLDKKKIPFNYDFTLFTNDSKSRNINDLRLPGHIMALLDRLMPRFRNPQEKIKSCNMCRTQGCISAKGDLFPCILFRKSCGNLINQTFKELWNSEKIKIYRDYKWDMMEICNNCILKNYCFICPGFNITEGAEWNIPAVEACRTGLARMGIF